MSTIRIPGSTAADRRPEARARRAATLLAALALAPAALANTTTDQPLGPGAADGALLFWAAFDTFTSGMDPYFFGSQPVRDAMNFGGDKDASNGGANFSAEAEISSGGTNANSTVANCNPQAGSSHRCGTKPSVFTIYYDGGTTWDGVYGSASMLDDYIAFRERIDATPDGGGTYKSNHWNILIDTDGDNYKEFWVDLDGKPSGSGDTVHIYYENINRQDITITSSPVLREDFQACPSASHTATGTCSRSFTRDLPVTVYEPTDTSADFFVDVAIPVWAFTQPTVGGLCPVSGQPPQSITFPGRSSPDNDTCFVILPTTTYRLIFSTSDSSTDPLQKDFTPGCGASVTDPCQFGAAIPVTLAWVETSAAKGPVTVNFATASEYRNAAFRVYADEAGLLPLDASFTASRGVNTTDPTEYSVRLDAAPPRGTFWLADFDTNGKRTMHGPFQVGQRFGRRPVLSAVDRAGAAKAQRVLLAKGEGAPPVDGAYLWVSQRGIHRVSYAAIAAAGVDLAGAPVTRIALTAFGQPVARRVLSADATFGPGDEIEFIGEPVETLYSARTPYAVAVDPASAVELAVSDLPAGPSGDAWAYETVTHAPQLRYNYASPLDDPWQAEQLFAPNGTPVGADMPLASTDVATVPGVDAQLSATTVGLTDWTSLLPDHRIALSLNGSVVATTTGDGVVQMDLAATVPVSSLAALNTGRVALTADTGFAFDMINVERVALRYPRLPVAEAGRWSADAIAFGATNAPPSQPRPAAGGGADLMLSDSFEGEALTISDSVLVAGLASPDVVAYRRADGVWSRLLDARTGAFGGGFGAWLPSDRRTDAQYLLSETSALLVPAVEPRRAVVDITSGAADYLVITHPAFTDSLAPLLAMKQAQGLVTAVVETTQVYRQFGHGQPGAAAIRSYLSRVVPARGVEYVLIVGGDSYDYKNYQGAAALSFVPTTYGQVNELITYAPSDTRYSDLDYDQVPDIAIGRLPARTPAELDVMIAKIARYGSSDWTPSPRMLAVAGLSETEQPFRLLSTDFTALVPNVGGDIVTGYVDDVGVANARATLLSTASGGPAFVSFSGHSAPGQWTYDPLLTTGDVASITNEGRPGVYLQWGCWTSYFVLPSGNTMSQALLGTPNRGAAATIGASALSDFVSHKDLSELLGPRLLEGSRIGDALLQAKRELGLMTQQRPDAIMGIELLGDPAMPLR